MGVINKVQCQSKNIGNLIIKKDDRSAEMLGFLFSFFGFHLLIAAS